MCLIKQQLSAEAWDDQQVHIVYMLENQVHPMALANMEASIQTPCTAHKPCHLSISRCKCMLRYMPQKRGLNQQGAQLVSIMLLWPMRAHMASNRGTSPLCSTRMHRNTRHKQLGTNQLITQGSQRVSQLMRWPQPLVSTL